ncbi:electron transfer flavoprotein subunit beta/FixA family protein [Niallia endozanthoxylica]|uniref:Electron transfer flavoprotein subunit beta/FixA family protein n=1 Tax=Niallia endozanthoxylica TaxID=2036016 RepID=A0A5J5I247_9BACI|nr:electron transfer flavoprotein subunit beta/FixA family protein [Niallia endozanthoxylica]KAA9028599.1 electron transfer flavoprotein subunit beta/FixA family protein [Niallia endozanthoxylica]
MRVVVCCKAVPTWVDNLEYDESNKKINYDGSALVMNESDEAAFEEALFLKKEYGAEVIVLTVGGLTSQEMLYQSLAKGADRVIRVSSDQSDDVAEILAKAIGQLECDLVLTGVESSDAMTAKTAMLLAEELQLPHAFVVTNIEYDEDQQIMKATSELGQGQYEVLGLPFPSLISVQSTTRTISQASVMKVLQARKKKVESMTLDSLGLTEDKQSNAFTIVDLFDPPVNNSCEMLEGNIEEILTVLMRRIADAAR